MLCGVGYRHPLRQWIKDSGNTIECLEITAEHFYAGHQRSTLHELGRTYPISVHGLGLSLGSPGGLRSEDLCEFVSVVEACQPRWISEHVAFTRTKDIDLGHLNPVPPTVENAELIAAKARELSNACECPILLENITSSLRLRGDLNETDFLKRICDLADCRLLLDITNLYINSRNHGFDAAAWLAELGAERIGQVHLVGYSCHGGVWSDSHAQPIQDDLWDLFSEIISKGDVDAAFIERDSRFEDARVDLTRDLSTMHRLVNRE
ncbi:MAG: DUF692 domain-containing protein [Rubripirellula sp.]|nr:DUF692 domain-containing protein [Rubripirellula sp.]